MTNDCAERLEQQQEQQQKQQRLCTLHFTPCNSAFYFKNLILLAIVNFYFLPQIFILLNN